MSGARICDLTGPGVTVTVNANRPSVWVAMRGRTLKCNMEQVRVANMEEPRGTEVMKRWKQGVFAHVDRAGQRGFVDVTHEGEPDEGKIFSLPPPSLPHLSSLPLSSQL